MSKNQQSQQKPQNQPNDEDKALDVVKALEKGEIQPEAEAGDDTDRLPENGKDGVLGDLSGNDPDANELRNDTVEAKKEAQEDEEIVPVPDAGKFVSTENKMSVEQVLAEIATNDDANVCYQRLLTKGLIGDPVSIEAELASRGYDIKPRHDENGQIIA